MPGIISPSPDGCLVGVYGHDGVQWVRIAVDASGQIAINAVSLPLPTGAATEATLDALYDVLRLNNLSLYDSLFSDSVSTNGSSGNLACDLGTVPADKILVLTACGLLLAAGSATFLQFSVSDGTNIRPFMRKLSPALNEMITCPPFVVVPPGGFVRGVAGSVGASSTVTIYATGYYVAYG